MIELGAGPALVVIPGLPGPWRFVAGAARALASRFRVLTISLGPECTIEDDVRRVAEGLQARHVDRAVICGISLGGLIALRFAATHPEKTTALVLVSSPGPGATLAPRHRAYVRHPWLCGPLFLLETPFMLGSELRWSHIAAAVSSPISFATIARRATFIETTDVAGDCRRVVSPTLVITGDEGRDRVVPVRSTLEYLRAIPGARHAVIASTGHLGSITRPEEFAGIVSRFVDHALDGRHDGAVA